MSGSGEVATESYAGKSWHVRRLSGASSSREYRCPGCHQGIAVGTAHVVAWPAHGRRRHRRAPPLAQPVLAVAARRPPLTYLL